MSKAVVLQICHGYDVPFGALAGCYARTVDHRRYRVVTVFLKGAANSDITAACRVDDDDEVLFLDAGPALKGLRIGLALRLRRLLRSLAPALIIGQRYKGFSLALWASVGMDIPVVGVAHAFGVMAPPPRRRLARWFRRRLWLLGVSDAVAADLRASATALPAARILTQHNMIDIAAASAALQTRAAARAALSVDGRTVIANVGRLHPDKDQALLIRAFARIAPRFPQADLWIVGRGRLAPSLAELARGLGVEERVKFPGYLPAVQALFPAFDLYVSTSHREPFGMVLLEAMVAGVPVLASDCGGAPEVLRGSGVLYPSGDEAALAQRLAEMLAALPRSEQVAAQRRIAEAHFSPAAFARQFRALPFWVEVNA